MEITAGQRKYGGPPPGWEGPPPGAGHEVSVYHICVFMNVLMCLHFSAVQKRNIQVYVFISTHDWRFCFGAKM